MDKDRYALMAGRRFEELVNYCRDHKGMSTADVSNAIGFGSYTYFNDVRKGNKSVGSYFIYQAVQAFPELDVRAFFDNAVPLIKTESAPQYPNQMSRQYAQLPASSQKAVQAMIQALLEASEGKAK